jgi:hypothetical protein
MTRLVLSLFCSVSLLCALASPVGGSLVVTEWRLSSIVDDNDLDTDEDRQFFLTVQNPFQASHTAIAGESFAATTYDFTWVGDDGSFDITTEQHSVQLQGRVSAGANIDFTPMMDSVFSYSAQYDYQWDPSVIGQAALSFRLVDLTLDELVFHEGRTGDNVGFDPPFGSLVIPEASANIVAGRQYKIIISALTDLFDETPPGSPGLSTGNIHFTITPVPEPATASLLIAGLLLSRRRPRSRRPRSR